MFGHDGDEDEDFSEELLALANSRVNELVEWCNNRSATIPNYNISNMTTDQAEESFQATQDYKLEYEDRAYEYKQLKDDHKQSLKSSDVFTPGDNALQSLYIQITDEENKLGLFLCFTYDFMNDRSKAEDKINSIQVSIDKAYADGTDIPTGITLIQDFLTHLSENIKLVSKANRKCVQLKKKYSPSAEITDKSKELSDKFMALKSKLNDKLTEAQQAQSHLDEYHQKLISYTATLTECESIVNNLLKKHITIAGNKIQLDEVNTLQKQIQTSLDNFQSIPILPDPSPTPFTIPQDIRHSQDTTISKHTLLLDKLSTWTKHVSTINTQLEEISTIS